MSWVCNGETQRHSDSASVTRFLWPCANTPYSHYLPRVVLSLPYSSKEPKLTSSISSPRVLRPSVCTGLWVRLLSANDALLVVVWAD